MNINKIVEKFNYLLSLGFTKDEIIKITKSIPSIFEYAISTIDKKNKDIMTLGYTKEEVIYITLNLPSIYTTSIESIKQKIMFYDSINVHYLAVLDAKKLMQSTSLTYARYQFLLSKGIIIDKSNILKLFRDSKRFEKTYGVTKEELLNKYNYDEYLKNNNSFIRIKSN